MVKKITALLLVATMLFSVPAFAATFSDVADDASEKSQAINVLSELGILSGMGDGTFSPYTNLTRAQFAKIAVCIMGKTKEAVVTTDAFSDVKSTDWYSGYVNVVAKEGIITGYPDGSFGADDSITYAQAITILIRLLGYDASDVGHKWPQGYIDKANVLGITEGVSFSGNDLINRETAALFIYRTLFSDMKNANASLVTKMDTAVYEDTVIIATSKQNSALMSNQVQTGSGTFTTKMNFDAYAGYQGTLVCDSDNEIVAFVPSRDVNKQEYTVSGVYSSEDNVFVMTEEAGTITLDAKASVYMNGSATTARALEEGVNVGSTISLFRENNNLKYVFLDEYKNEGPQVVFSTKNVENIFDVENKETLKVVRKGLSATLEDIELYDVLYYSEKTNTIYAYNDRVTGVYEKAYPMKSNVSKVTVSGKEYQLSTQEAVNKLNESTNAFKIGDRVTLLFGENGSVVDAVSLTGTDASLYGVVTKTGTRVSEKEETSGRTEYTVSIMDASGEVYEYAVESDVYEDKAGMFCKVDFENGYALLTFPKNIKKTGKIDKDKETMGEYPFAGSYTIMEYLDGNETTANVSVLNIADIDDVTILTKNVKHVQLNGDGEIVFLYLDNVSGNRNIYGVITSVPETKTGTYTVLSGSKTYTKTGTLTSYKKGDVVGYYNGIEGVELSPTIKIAQGYSITDYTDNVIVMGSVSYTLSDDVTVYQGRSVSDLKTASLNDLTELKGSIYLYSDRGIKEGGKVRVITIITG